MGTILTKTTASSSSTGGGVYTSSEKLAMELEMSFKASKLYYYKEFSYSGGNLAEIDIYEDTTKAVKLFNKSILYTSGNVAQTVLTRISDNEKVAKRFYYNVDGTLNNIRVTELYMV